jgi:hypothetical protein
MSGSFLYILLRNYTVYNASELLHGVPSPHLIYFETVLIMFLGTSIN